MKRRNADSTKHRKQFTARKCKFTEGMYGSNSFVYMKFLLLWSLIMIADYVLEFRFEFLWPFWLLLRSLHDSIKYQGIIFAVFFASIAFFSDLVCYMFIPVHWLFFIASTYVWVQYVWHTDKGICLSTVFLWLFFVYIEAYLRLNNFKTSDLCRPFAAHCIGYPIVTLGFGFKSYINYKYRLKKQKKIQKQNDFYHSLVKKALPLEFQLKESDSDQEISTKEANTEIVSKIAKSSKTNIFSTALSYYLHSNQPSSSSTENIVADVFPYIQQKDSVNTKKNNEKNFSQKCNNSESADFSKANFSTKQYSNCSIKSSKQLNSANRSETNDQVNGLNLPSFSIQSLALTQNSYQNQNGDVNLNGINVNSNGNLVLMSNGSSKNNSNHNRSSSNTFIPNNTNHTNININMTINTTAIATATATATNNPQNQTNNSNTFSNTSSNNTKKNKNKDNKSLTITNNRQGNGKIPDDSANECNYKQELINSLEMDMKKLKIEIEQQKKVEQYLRDQINYITKCDRSEKLKQENESLQSKINELRVQKDKERDHLEKQLQDERKKRTDIEAQLAKEKKLRETSSLSVKKASQPQNTPNGVNEQNQKKINQLENENKELKDDCGKKQDTIVHLENEINNLSSLLQSNENIEKLKKKLKNIEEKNTNLQESLREETRFKMNLLSALGEAKRQIEYVNRQLDTKDNELSMMKAMLLKQSLSHNSFPNSLLNETAQTDLISQLLADQLSNLQNHNYSSNQLIGNHNCPSEESRSLSCSSPGASDMNRMSFSPTNDNNTQNFDSMEVKNIFPKI